MESTDTHGASRLTSALLKIAAVLWIIWGLVHVFAGAITIFKDAPQAVAGIADAVDPDALMANYHDAVGAIINQHGFNLLWIGVVTTVCAFYIWRRSTLAIFLAALVGGLTDTGYFLFMDRGGHVHFVPGTVMTLICASAIAISFFAHFRRRV